MRRDGSPSRLPARPAGASCALLVEEQRAFERDIPFERFAGGVERARRVPRQRPRRFWFAGIGGAARRGGRGAVPGAAALAAGPTAPRAAASRPPCACASAMLRRNGRCRPARKRCSSPETAFASATAPRSPATSPRSRSTTAARSRRSIPKRVRPCPSAPTAETVYLPDSLEFTGAGREKVFLFLARTALRQRGRQAGGQEPPTKAPRAIWRALPNPDLRGRATGILLAVSQAMTAAAMHSAGGAALRWRWRSPPSRRAAAVQHRFAAHRRQRPGWG